MWMSSVVLVVVLAVTGTGSDAKPVSPTPAHALVEEAPPAPAGLIAEMDPDEEIFQPMKEADWQLLQRYDWSAKAGMGRAVWISVARQRFHLIEDGAILWEVTCATALAGTGSLKGSLKTPLGWHRVAEKFGDDAPWGQVFRSRAPTKEIWKPGMDTKEDLVLTRILWLDGLEPGVNKGRAADGSLVDSRQRYIYIHGTNGEDVIGQPSSHGCIRMLNDDVILAYEMIPEDTKVLITQE